jgi:hypothetical protein
LGDTSNKFVPLATAELPCHLGFENGLFVPFHHPWRPHGIRRGLFRCLLPNHQHFVILLYYSRKHAYLLALTAFVTFTNFQWLNAPISQNLFSS